MSMDTIEQVATQTAIEQGKAEVDGSASVIAVEDLHKSFGSQTVLNAVSLTVKRGETFAVLGRSGTGKSVLLRLIVGLEKPDSGSIRIHGKDIAGLTLDKLGEVRKKIGFLFQHAALYDSLTVEQNIAFPLQHNRKDISKSERQHRVKALLAEVGMEGDLTKMPSDISGGSRNESGWLGRWLWSRIFCCSMSPPPVLIRSAPRRLMISSSSSRRNITWRPSW